MRDGGRIAAAIAVLEDFDQRRVPLKVALADWARGARFAGAKDRAFISGLCLDVLRHRGHAYGLGMGARGAVAWVLSRFWEWAPDRIDAAYAEEPHGPGALTSEEKARVAADPEGLSAADAANVRDFALPLLERALDDPAAEAGAMASRAPTDLRVNTLKADPEKVLKALAGEGGETSPLLATGLRIPAPIASDRGPQITVSPAFQKGWVEVQDIGSQLSALAAGSIAGMQVLDYCAGGGGKTLALAAMMDNTGQIFAYDRDAHRLAPAFERLKRAGVRNAQVISPAPGGGDLSALEGRMDVVFVDAPCSGSGTWRRHPDTKWRLTEAQLARRQEEQDQVLAEAAAYVKPGGALVYVTCSVFAEENEDRIAAFLTANPAFKKGDAAAAMRDSGLLLPGVTVPERDGVVRLSPATTQTDAFTITRLTRAD